MIDNQHPAGQPAGHRPPPHPLEALHVDMNDRQLRFIVDGLGGKVNGTPREDGFDITVASEVMAILCLATSISRSEGASFQDRMRLHLRRQARHCR